MGMARFNKGVMHHALLIACSFLLPLVIVFFALLALHVEPFGVHNLAISDGEGYVKGLVGTKSMLESIFINHTLSLYSFSGLGSNTWAGLAWGGFYPAMVLSLLATMETAPIVFTLICAVNMALCGLTMYILLAYIRGHQVSNLIFSTSYALMGFTVVNCYQTLFFIGPQMLPLVIMGLVKLLRGESPLLYILSFGFCTFCNFYFGFHIAVATVILCLAYLFVFKGKKEGRNPHPIRTYAISSFIGGFLPAVMWLPALKAYTGGGRIDQAGDIAGSLGASNQLFSENMPFIQIFAKLFSGANSTSELVEGLPNIFVGVLVIALVVLFFMNKKIPVRNRQVVAVVLVFYLISFYIVAFTMAMHGGTQTNWFPYRYSYVFSFLLICVAAEQFKYLPDTSLAETKKCGVVILLTVLVVFSVRYEFIQGSMVLIDLAILLAMWAAFRFYKLHPDRAPFRVLTLMLLVFVSGNLYVNYVVSVHSMQDWEMNLSEYGHNVLTTGAFVDAVKQVDDSFYRLEKDWSESGTMGSDAGFYGYHGVGGAGPTKKFFINEESSRLGLAWFDMRHWYPSDATAATDALFGLKYVFATANLEEVKGYKELAQSEGKVIYQNDNTLKVATVVDSGVQGVELGDDLFQNLNAVWRSMSGVDKDVFVEQDDVSFTLHNIPEPRTITSDELAKTASNSVDTANGASSYAESQGSSGSTAGTTDAGVAAADNDDGGYIEYRFTASRDGAVYVFNTALYDSWNGSDHPQIDCVGVFKKGDEVVGKAPFSKDYLTKMGFEETSRALRFAYADDAVLSEMAKILQSRDVTFDADRDDRPYGAFEAGKNKRLLFTMPWDEGWKCYIDGQEVAIDKTWDVFMSVEVPEGSHEWKMEFVPAWMNYGIAISVTALLALIAYMAVRRIRGKTKRNEFTQRAA